MLRSLKKLNTYLAEDSPDPFLENIIKTRPYDIFDSPFSVRKNRPLLRGFQNKKI